MRLLLVCCVATLLATTVSAQDNRQLLRQAIQLENDGQIKMAISLYERLLARSRRNTSVLYRLATAYQKTGRFDEAVQLLEVRLKLAPGDVTALSRLRDVYFAAGDQAEADRQVQRMLEVNPSQGTYLSAGQRYERRNQDQKAEAVYLRGRQVLEDKDAFSRELAQIYERAERYLESVREYSRLARQKPQYVALVESHIRSIAAVAPEPTPLFDHLLGGVKAAHRDSRITRLFVTFAIASGTTGEALDAILLLPPGARIEGSLLRLGRETLAQDRPNQAQRAFSALIERTKNRTIQGQAAVGIARSLDRMGRSEEALEAYRQSLKSGGSDTILDESVYRAGELLRRMGRVDASLALLCGLVDGGRRSEWRTGAIDLIGDLHQRAGRAEEAERAYRLNVTEHRGKEPAAVSNYLLARLYVTQKQYGDAQKALASILNGTLSTRVYNDAIELSDIIETGLPDDQAALDAFADGLRMETRGDTLRAANAYLAAASAANTLADILYRRGIDRLLRTESWSRAEESLRESGPSDPGLASWAAFWRAYCLERLKRTDEAITIYEDILVDHPATLEADRSRDRLTELRAAPRPGEAG